MIAREELLYEAFKSEMNAVLATAEDQAAQVKNTLLQLLQGAQTVVGSLPTVQSNPLLARRFEIRKLLWPLIPFSNLLEICVDTRLPALVGPLKEALNRLASSEVALTGTEVTTNVVQLPRNQYRVDQLVVSQRVEIRTGGAAAVDSEPLSFVVHQPFFLKIKKGGKLEIVALTTPIVIPNTQEAELVAADLEFKLVGMVFAGEFKSEMPLELPGEFTKQGLRVYSVRLVNDLVRIYYSSRRAVPPTEDAPRPGASSLINIKLTRQLFDDIFQPKVKNQMGESSIGLEKFNLSLLENVQLVRVEIVGSRRVSQYVGNVNFWGKGFAKVVQLIKFTRTGNGQLQVRGEGGPQLQGDPWVGEAGAHMDTLIGEGFGVSLPDEAVDILWEVAKALRVGLPNSLPSSTFDEVVNLSPQRLVEVWIRSSDAVLLTQ